MLICLASCYALLTSMFPPNSQLPASHFLHTGVVVLLMLLAARLALLTGMLPHSQY